ncbi:MAG: hypothetical protein JSV09_00145, partial [Thermoplasmata archaeon]
MRRKTRSVFLCIIFSISIFSAFEITTNFIPKAKGEVLYVGGSGGGNYSKIEDAIEAANPGDTVFVFSGTYY